MLVPSSSSLSLLIFTIYSRVSSVSLIEGSFLKFVRTRRSSLSKRAPFLGIILQFQWFLMVFSGRPGRKREMEDHLFPKACTPSTNTHSSHSLHSCLVTPSFKWLCHLSRHCFAFLPSNWEAMNDQSLAPLISTKERNISSY